MTCRCCRGQQFPAHERAGVLWVLMALPPDPEPRPSEDGDDPADDDPDDDPAYEPADDPVYQPADNCDDDPDAAESRADPGEDRLPGSRRGGLPEYRFAWSG